MHMVTINFQDQMKLFVYVERSVRIIYFLEDLHIKAGTCHFVLSLSYWGYIHFFVELVKAWTEVRHSCPCGLLFGGFPVSVHGEGRIPCPGC